MPVLSTSSRRKLTGPNVYFLEAAGTGLVKIGHAKNLKERVADLRTMSPVPLTLIGILYGGRDREQEIHKILAGFRRHGEWFARTPMMDAIIRADGDRRIMGRLADYTDNDEYLLDYLKANFTQRPTVEAGNDAALVV